MSLATSAAQETAKFSEMAFNAAKLREAWEITKRAIDNPRDRALGLAALRLNPTLGMHAIAWAAMEKQPPDPIARMFSQFQQCQRTNAGGQRFGENGPKVLGSLALRRSQDGRSRENQYQLGIGVFHSLHERLVYHHFAWTTGCNTEVASW